MNDGINGETTGDGLQDTYDLALIQLVGATFDIGEVPAMVQRAYLGDDVLPDWESSLPLTPQLPDPAPEPQQQRQQQAAVLIPVRHQAEAIPAWRKALIQVLAAGIARLA